MKRTADERYVAHLGFTGVYQGAGQWFVLPNGVFQENTGIGMVFEHGIEGVAYDSLIRPSFTPL